MKLQEAAEEARKANEERYAQAMKIYEDIEAMYAPGGAFGAGYEAELEATKKRDVASEVSQSISSGLFGTTVPTTAAKRWEETVGAPARLKLEDLRMGKYAEAMGAKAGLIERREDVYPDYSTIANLLMQSGGGYGGGTSYTSELGPMASTGRDVFGRPLNSSNVSSYVAASADVSLPMSSYSPGLYTSDELRKLAALAKQNQ
jgi:hypothetical protein